LFVAKLVIWAAPPREYSAYFAASALYLHNAAFGVTSMILGVAWSLEVEVQFYLLMPLLALVFLIRNTWPRRAILIGAALAIMLVQPIRLPPIVPTIRWTEPSANGVIAKHEIYTQSHTLHLGNYIQYFLAGLLLADIYVTEWKNNPARRRWGDVVWLIGWPLWIYTAFQLKAGYLAARLAFPVIIFALYIALFRSTLARRVLSWPFIAVIGGMCYSIYLLHNSAIEMSCKLIRAYLPGRLFGEQILIAAAVALPSVLIACATYFRLIEKPCMRRDWPQRLWAWLTGLMFVDEHDDERIDAATGQPITTKAQPLASAPKRR
jgi:peptidoglycan/LPS O-acetylase OafA/YrhL